MTSSVPNSTPLHQWFLPGKSVALFREQDKFLCSIGEGTEKKMSFRPKYCDMDSAATIIKRFHTVIGVNLKEQEITSSCFLPFCVMPAQNIPDCDVALFAKIDNSHPVKATVQWLRCGIALSEKKIFPIEKAHLNNEFALFVKEAPLHNRLIMKPPSDDQNDSSSLGLRSSLVEESSDSRPMDAYKKRFRILAEKNGNNQIINLTMQKVSFFDPSITLDDNHWAITLVSTDSSSMISGVRQVFSGAVGHAMLACEGVRAESFFLEYIHLTQRPLQQNPLLTKETAQIERFCRERPLNTRNGPTWARSKAAVEHLFCRVEQKKTQPIAFSLSVLSYAVRFFAALPALGVVVHIAQHLHEKIRTNREPAQNCLNFITQLTEEAGIIFCRHDRLTTPLHKIDVVNRKPSYQIPNDSDPNQENGQIASQIDRYCVVLTPQDCDPSQFSLWADFVHRKENPHGIFA